MQKIASSDFIRLASFVQTMPQYMALAALLEGACPHAIAYADNDSALIAINARLYAFGKLPSLELLETAYFPVMRPKYPYVLLHLQNEAQKAAIPELLAAYEPREYPRLSLRLTQAPPNFALAADYRLAEVNAALLADTTLENLNLLREESCSERVSVDDFLAKSFGLCLLKENTLIGWCLSEYNNAQGCEVGIEIMEAYQRQGLGAALAAAFIRLAQKRGLPQIGWHCWEGNQASVQLALKLGFETVAKESVFVLRL